MNVYDSPQVRGELQDSALLYEIKIRDNIIYFPG